MKDKKYDAVVVMGAGFRSPESDELDVWGENRVAKAAETVRDHRARYMFITGLCRHDNGMLFTHQAMNAAIRYGVCPYIVPSDKNFSIDTEGDVNSAIFLARRLRYNRLLIVTERPHWWRVKPLFKEMAPELTVAFLKSMPAPWWYYAKEATYVILKFFGLRKFLIKIVRPAWKRFTAKHGKRMNIYIPSNLTERRQ